jgi:5-formyltetrahydrofolate cyclo-ligase
MSNSTKDKIRTILLDKRSQLTKQEQHEKSECIVKNIKQSELFIQASNIAFYHSVRGEADPSGLANKNTNRQKQFYLPVLSTDKKQGLIFASINQNTQYKNNQFLIPEPIVKPSDYSNAETLDIVIMPLLGFDLKGNRLGMGGGYYDRCLAFKKSNIKKPILLGFAYDFQQVDLLSAEPWDIGLDAIATESQFIHFNNK